MTKNFSEITSQCYAVRNDTSTLAFYLNVEPVPLERFKELIEGKVKISLYDYSNGKGDNGIRTYYNLDLDDVEYLYSRARLFFMPEPFYGSKIIGSAPQRDGPYKGLCPVTKITIARTEADSSGKRMRNPWSISISNGFAVAARGRKAGTFYEKSGTYVETGKARMMLTDKTFLYAFDKIKSYLAVEKILAGSKLIPQGVGLLKEKYNQRGYSSEISPQESQNYVQEPNYEQTGQTAPAESYAPQNANMTPVQNDMSYSQYSQNAYEEPYSQGSYQMKSAADTVEYHPTVVTFASEFQALENNIYIASCLAGGNEYPIFFPTVPQELKNAQENQWPIRINLYMKDKEFWFHSIAA